MAAPNYGHDLVDITLAETTTNWSALGGGASGLSASPDIAMQGTNCVDKQVTASEKGQVFNNGATITNSTNRHFFIWAFMSTPGLTDTLANRGLAMILGTATTAYAIFAVEGNNTYGAAGRVGKCYAIRYVNSTGTNRTLVGSPGANPQYFGATANITATVKGANLGVDAIRYGTGAYITAGELADPATFVGFQTTNDNITNRFGIFTNVSGTYELQGRFVIGQNNAETPTLAYFSDSNKNIVIVDTLHGASDFTQIIIDHASTEVYWNNINITALGTINRGQLVLNNASSIVELTGGALTNIGISTLRAGFLGVGVTWRNTDIITQNSATLTDCIFIGTFATHHILSNNPSLITGCNFISDGSGHAVRCDTVGTYNWDGNTDSGYTGTRGSNLVSSSGSTDAMFYNNSGGLITLNVGAGGQSPSVRNGAGATTVIVAGTSTLTIKAITTLGVAIQYAAVTIKAGSTGDLPYQDSVTITRSGSVATVSHTAHGLSTGQKVLIQGANQNEYNRIKTITVTGTDTYTYTVEGTPTTPATGTIIATAVIIDGVTDVNGEITDTRVYTNTQSLEGAVKKGTSIPVYRSSPVTDSIGVSTTKSINVVMIDD